MGSVNLGKAAGNGGGPSTRERILVTARDLFNAEGTGHQSALDIATALGISAGHLYYHFKGKPQIVAELLAEHAGEVDLVLEAMLGADATLEGLWTHVHILAEEAWDARFFWREPALAMGNPRLAELAQGLLSRQRQALGAMLAALEAAGVIAAPPEVLDGLARQLVTGIAFHAIALELEGDPGPPRDLIARAAAQIMLPVAGLTVA
jgi:AcrR family transcriptional regulator